MTKHSLAASCALALASFGLATTSLAGTTVATGKESKPVLKEAVKESCITGDIGVVFTSQYVSRGSVLENQGVIAQPYIDLYFSLYKGEGFVNSVSLNLGLWSSIHSEKTDQGLVNGTGTSSTPSWYEFDYTAGVSIGFAQKFTFSLTYMEFNYPNDGFFTQRLGQAKLAFDDSDLLGAFSLKPYVKYEYYFETPDEGSYFEVGIAPGFTAGPVGVSFPITAGFGASDFYVDATGNNEAFGYVSGGVALSYGLSFIPECYGAWTLTAGYTYYYLGDALEDFNTASRGGAVRDANEHEHVFSGGIGLVF